MPACQSSSVSSRIGARRAVPGAVHEHVDAAPALDGEVDESAAALGRAVRGGDAEAASSFASASPSPEEESTPTR
jgi:hypothetical protein